jgi:hypothetical protein
LTGVPELANFDRIEHGRKPSVVVRVRVRQHDDIDDADTARAQHRNERLCTRIGAAPDAPARVDQRDSPVDLDQARVALSDIEKGHAQFTLAELEAQSDLAPHARR